MSQASEQRGFTFIEIAIVLAIVGILLAGLLIPLPAQMEIRRTAETQETLSTVKEALLGYATAQGRLPCPAAPNTTGAESPLGGGTCSNAYDGFVPGITLGLPSVDPQGYVLDAWGNRLRMIVSRDPTSGTNSSNAGSTPRYSFTTTDKIAATGISSVHPDIHVCRSGTVTPSKQCATGETLTDNAVVAVFSTGKNGATAPIGTDEQRNASAGDRVLVSHPPQPANAVGGEFDDAVTWLSPNLLIGRLVTAGRLP